MLSKQLIAMSHSRCWFSVLVSLILFYDKYKLTAFIIPLSSGEDSSEKYNETSTSQTTPVFSTSENIINSFIEATTVLFLEDDSYEISSTTDKKDVEPTTENPSYINNTVEQSLNLSTVFDNEIVLKDFPTESIFLEESETIQNVILPREIPTMNEVITFSQYEYKTTPSSVEPIYITVTDEYDNEPIIKEKKVIVNNDIERSMHVTSYFDLQPSIEDNSSKESLLWYTLESSTAQYSLQDITTNPSTISYTATPYIEVPPVKEVSTSNPIYLESKSTTTERILATSRVWYVMNSDGVPEPYTGFVPDFEQTTSLSIPITTTPTVTTVVNPVKTSYCFKSNGTDSNKFCIYGCNDNIGQLKNCFINYQPRCYYFTMDSSNHEPICMNFKTNNANVHPLCCYKQYYTEEPSVQYNLPSSCYEYQFSFPFNILYYKCN